MDQKQMISFFPTQRDRICRSTFSTLYLFFLVALVAPMVSSAADFDGNLKGVTITDPAKANAPPTAVIKSVKDGDFLIFDGSASTDSDGSIVAYRWDFGNGKTAEGKTVTYEYVNDGEMHITLTVVDNGGAVSLAFQKYEYFEIVDNFDNDSSDNYTNLAGGITVSGGVVHGQKWTLTQSYSKIALAGQDHWVQADVTYNGISDSGGLIVRVDPTNQTGYAVYFSSGAIHLGKFVGSLSTWLAYYKGQYATGTYKVKLEAVGSTLNIYVNGTKVITKVDTTYPAGPYVGIRLYRGSANADVTIDNLTAKTK